MLHIINMQVSDNTLGSWTRSKNDQPTCENDNSKNSELYRFMTFAPDYLKEGSCVAGNTQNCATYSSMDVANEPRFGQLTNLNEIQRESTNDPSMGVRTTPDFSSGRLVDPRLIQDMSVLESKVQFTSRIDVPSTSQMDKHHFDEEARFMSKPPEAEKMGRSEIRVSSRVERRNSYAKSCKRAS